MPQPEINARLRGPRRFEIPSRTPAVFLIAASLLGIVAIFRSVPRADAAPPQSISKQVADEAAAKLRRLQSGQPFGTLRLTEDEVNSYLQFIAPQSLPPGISKVRLRFIPGRPQARADLDFDKMKDTMGSSSNPIVGYFLRGAHTISVEGNLTSAHGSVQFDLDTVTLDGVTVPEPVVDFLIEHYVNSRYPDVSLDGLSDLPYSIDKVTVEDGAVVFYKPQ